MTRFLPVCVVVFAVGLNAHASAARDFSEAEYLTSFHSQHPARAILDETVGRARADVRSSGLLENPVGGFEREAPDNLEQNTWSLSWAPPLDGRRSARKAAAKAALEFAEGERGLAGAELRSTLREAYARWALASERAAIWESPTRRLRQLATGASQRAQSGEASVLSARRIALAVIEIEAAAARADVERIDEESIALGWLGVTGDELTPLRPSLPTEAAPSNAGDTPTVAVRRSQVSAAQANARWSGRFVQFPELMFGWQTVDEFGVGASGPVMGVAWPIPIFDRRQGDREAAQATVTAAQARLDLETHRVSARLEAAKEGYNRLRDAALSAADSLAISDEVMESAAARFELGESDVTELLETVRGVISARLAALDLYDAALAAHRELELLMGRSWFSEEE
jgi:cobalt-zinc-cadmium efflux system outer membrane protein